MTTLKEMRSITVEEYLERENRDPERNEFVDGEIIPMAWTTQTHNRAVGNVLVALGGHLRGTKCRVFFSTLKLRVGDDFYYPDVFVACDPKDTDPYFVTRPVLIVDILSPGSTSWLTRHKLRAYKGISSLREYLVVQQARRRVRVHRRAGKGWRTRLYTGSQSIKLASVDLSLPLDDVYRDVLRQGRA